MNAAPSKTAPLLLRLVEAIVNVRLTLRLPVPEGYEDENGFHYGPQPAEQKIAWPPA